MIYFEKVFQDRTLRNSVSREVESYSQEELDDNWTGMNAVSEEPGISAKDLEVFSITYGRIFRGLHEANGGW